MSLSIALLAATGRDIREGWNQGDLREVNNVLKGKNDPTHFEPLAPTEAIAMPEINLRYSDFVNLQYLLSKFIENPKFELDVIAFNRNRRKNRRWGQISSRKFNQLQQKFKSHLISHASLYLPIEFESVIYVESYADPMEWGPWVGSSIRLEQELREVACRLDLKIKRYTPQWKIFYRDQQQALSNDPMGDIKLFVLLYHAIAAASLYYNSAITIG